MVARSGGDHNASALIRTPPERGPLASRSVTLSFPSQSDSVGAVLLLGRCRHGVVDALPGDGDGSGQFSVHRLCP